MKKALKTILWIVLGIVFLFTACSFFSTEQEPANKTVSDNGTGKSESENSDMTLIEPLDYSDYTALDAELLYEYGDYLCGEKILTVITIEEIGSDYLNARTENNDSMWYSIHCVFEDCDLKKLCKKGDILTVAGIVQEKTGIGKAVRMGECAVAGMGEMASELKENQEEQRAYCEIVKLSYEERIVAAAQAEKEAYISQCETLNYKDIERNPDSYDGKNVKISGKVIQVSEGWFDSVKMRISCNGEIWYVTYEREEGESRILENDVITAYGECSGVKSYTTILGSQVTIPSMEMEYYN